MDINKFCKNYNKDTFLKLPLKTQRFFLRISKIILDNWNNNLEKCRRSKNCIVDNHGFVGLAYIIKNILEPSIPKKEPEYISGIMSMNIFTSKKHKIKVMFLEDMHSMEFNCKTKEKNILPVTKFIENQIATSTDFVDLFLEVPYISRKKGEIKSIGHSYMADVHEDLSNCFEWSKKMCEYPNLRSHYVDLRTPDMDYDFFKFQDEIIEYYFTGNVINKSSNTKLWTNYRNNTKLAKILKTKVSFQKHIKKIILKSKIQKQIDNIEDVGIKKIIEKKIETWLNNPTDTNIDWKYMTWDYIMKALETGNKKQIGNIYYSLASYSGILMDAYTIARMFRKYSKKPNVYSGVAKNIIIFAGGQHTQRYIDVLKQIGMDAVFETARTEDNCVNIKKIKKTYIS